jgi:hypothetical protein
VFDSCRHASDQTADGDEHGTDSRQVLDDVKAGQLQRPVGVGVANGTTGVRTMWQRKRSAAARTSASATGGS